MKATPLPLAGLLRLEPQVHGDARGFFVEAFVAKQHAALGVPGPFVQENHSRSAQGVLRGLHWQWRVPQGKLVRCARGAIFDVAVDLRKGSGTFGRWAGARLDDLTHHQLWIPPGFAHGFCVLSEVADVIYQVTAPYDPEGEGGLAWNDPEVGISWPLQGAPQLSARDQGWGRLQDLPPTWCF